MIKKLLTIRNHSFEELYEILKNTHTRDSLKIELDFLIQIGSVTVANNIYSKQKIK
jgi:hypothetical protein